MSYGRRGLTIIGVLVAFAAGCGSGSDSGSSPQRPPTNAVASTTTSTIEVESAKTYSTHVKQVIPFKFDKLDPTAPPKPLFVSVGAGAVWVGQHRSHAVSRVDPKTGAIVATIAIDRTTDSIQATKITPTGPATGTGTVYATDDAIWVLDHGEPDVGEFIWRIDPKTNKIVTRMYVPVLRADAGAAVRNGELWSLSQTGFNRVDTVNNWVNGQYPLASPGEVNGPQIVAAPHAVFMASSAGIVRVDPATNKEQLVLRDRDAAPLGVATDGKVWVADAHKVSAIDPTTNKVTRTIDKPADTGSLRPDSATYADNSLWVMAYPQGDTLGKDKWWQLVRFDLATGHTDHFDVMNAEFEDVIGVGVTANDVWITDFERGNLLRVDPTAQ